MSFEAGWWGIELEGARPGMGTYVLYRAETLPPLPAEIAPDFAFLRAKRTGMPAAGLEGLRAACAPLGLALPADLVAFFSDTGLGAAVPSCTACEWDLASAPVPCPSVPGTYTVRLYRDQQDCLFWYALLGPGGAASVVCSPIPFDEVSEPDDVVRANTVVVAPDFTSFVGRWWLENELWDALSAPKPKALTPRQAKYVAHYR